MPRALVIAEHDGRAITPATASTLHAAAELNAEIIVLVAGHQCAAACTHAARHEGVQSVLHADHACFEHPLAEDLAALCLSVADGFTHLLAPANSFGRNFLPRVAAKLGVGQTSDVVEILDDERFVRPLYAGNALQTVYEPGPVHVLTVRPAAFERQGLGDTPASVRSVAPPAPTTRARFISHALAQGDRPALSEARVVVAGGRALTQAGNFDLVEQLATALDAAVGASRAAVDAGLAGNDLQVGQTGQVVAPELYIALGISGAIQHLAGMSGSQVIVAINKDSEAPIFDVADYGLVADVYSAVPAFIAALKKVDD